MVYIIGHKSPDLDSVAAAIAYADLKNKLKDGKEYKPAIAGDINKETEHVLERFGFEIPEKLESLAGKEVVLVDHNESPQMLKGFEEAEIKEVLDHHKVNFSYDKPISFETLPWGSSATMVADKFFFTNVGFDKNLASLMLSAILVDTVITKSPTCTEKDEQVIKRLAKVAEIDDPRDLGIQIFKVRSSIDDLSPQEVIKNDYKEYDLKDGKFFINQIETVDINNVNEREEELIQAMKDLKEQGYHSVITFVTDIFKEGSKFWVVTDDENKMSEALGRPLNEEIYLEGVMSRKKQVVPMLSEIFDK